MSHVRRFAIGTAWIMMVLVFGLVLDAVVYPLLDINYNMGVDNGPFGAVLGPIEGAATILVPMLLLGIVMWLVWGSIQEERAEEQRRRVR